MMETAQTARTAGARVLQLLRVNDLHTLCERTKNLSITQSVDFVLPVVAQLTVPDVDNVDRQLQPAVGVALYQCLIQQQLTGRSMDAAIDQAVAGEYKRPREFEPGIPKALEAIILRALRERPEERFHSMHDLGAALLPYAGGPVQKSYVGQLGPRIGPAPSGADAWPTDEVTETRRVRRRGDLKLVAAVLAIALPFLLARLSNDEPAPASTTEAAPEKAPEAAPVAPTSAPTPTREPPPEPAPEAARARAEPVKPAKTEARTDREAPAADAAKPVRSASANARSTYAIDLTAEPSTAWIMLDGKAAGRGRLERKLRRDGTEHDLHVGAPGYKVQAFRFKDAPPPASVVLEKR